MAVAAAHAYSSSDFWRTRAVLACAQAAAAVQCGGRMRCQLSYSQLYCMRLWLQLHASRVSLVPDVCYPALKLSVELLAPRVWKRLASPDVVQLTTNTMSAAAE